jgi:hypothetical protein
MHILPPVVLLLALSGALYKFVELWPENTSFQQFQQQWKTQAVMSARETLDARRMTENPEGGNPMEWMGEASGGAERGRGFQYGSGGAGRSSSNPLQAI